MSFIVGAIVASFSYVVGVRLPQRQNWWTARSQCPYCQATLTWYELLPIISFLWQRGRCRLCRCRIAWRYVLFELAGGVMSYAFYALYGMSLQWGLALLLMLFCFIVSASDLTYMIVPNKVLLYVGLPLALLYSLQQSMYSMITGAVVAFGLLYAIHLLTDGIGAGDVKLVAILGAIVQIEQLFFMLSIACMIGFCLFAMRRTRIIPFAPALCVATVVTLYVDELQWLRFFIREIPI